LDSIKDEEKTKEQLLEELKLLRERLSQVEETKKTDRKAELKFQGLLEAAPDGIIIVDRAGRITLVNAQTEKLFGYLREELLGRPIEILVPERFCKAHVGHRENYHAQPRTRPMGVGLDLTGRRKDGSEFPVEISLSPIETEKGQQVISIVRDITEQRRTSRALQESREQLQAILDYTTAVIFVKDLEGRYLLVNRRYEQLFHVTNRDIIEKTDFDLLPKETAEAVRANDQKVLESGAPLELEEVVPSDGEPHTYIAIKFPLRDASGKLFAVCGIATDITDRKRAEEKLREKIREMDDFIHVVSHDLKEPLRGIEAFAGFLAEDYAHLLDEEGRRYVHFLKSSAIRMKDLIHDLLTLASISRKVPTLQQVDLNQTLLRIQQDLEYTIQQKKARIECHTPLPTVVCDPTQIGEVFKNLLSNAIKFNTSSVPEVEIAVKEEERAYLFSIQDNGIGIDPRYRERIFGLFERLHPQEQFEGTGAGLAICKKIIEGCGGKIWVKSEVGKGSTFFFTLPKRQG
jgi:PAS domain S-box-containing protein